MAAMLAFSICMPTGALQAFAQDSDDMTSAKAAEGLNFPEENDADDQEYAGLEAPVDEDGQLADEDEAAGEAAGQADAADSVISDIAPSRVPEVSWRRASECRHECPRDYLHRHHAGERRSLAGVQDPLPLRSSQPHGARGRYHHHRAVSRVQERCSDRLRDQRRRQHHRQRQDRSRQHDLLTSLLHLHGARLALRLRFATSKMLFSGCPIGASS